MGQACDTYYDTGSDQPYCGNCGQHHAEHVPILARRKMPVQKPGRSKQDYRTPKELLDAVRQGLNITDFYRDLAADATNAVCMTYWTEKDNSLSKNWHTPKGQWNWCNPPFAQLKPWVSKACVEGVWGNTVMLVPAGVGSNWWRDWVHKKCMVWFLNGRLTFVGETTPYPKDCALLLYGRDLNYTGYGVWDWRKGGSL